MQAVDLRDVLNRVDTWKGRQFHGSLSYLQTASTELNDAVGGIPSGALTEVLTNRSGIGELSLLEPAMRESMNDDRWLVAIGAPYHLYGPELERKGLVLRRLMIVSPGDASRNQWAAEQCLRSGACGMVMLWGTDNDTQVSRRLQLAAEQGRACGVLFRPTQARNQSSHAALRFLLASESAEAEGGLDIRILKQRGSLRSPEISWRY